MVANIADLPTQYLSTTDVAIEALAEAMAARLNPYNTAPPTTEITARATMVVHALLDRAGRPFTVLMHGDEEDAKRLAKACGKGEDFLGEALRVIERLTHPETGQAAH